MKSYIDYFSDVIGVENIKEYINSVRGGESTDTESTDDVELNIDETPEKIKLKKLAYNFYMPIFYFTFAL